LTHSAWTQFYCPSEALDLVTSRFWTDSQIVNELNFGMVEVEEDVDTDIKVHLKIVNIDNQVRLHRVFSLKDDLTFDEVKLRYSLLCQHLHDKGAGKLQIFHIIETVIDRSQAFVYLILGLITSILSLTIAMSVKVTAKIFTNQVFH
jgi:hypothetical protein